MAWLGIVVIIAGFLLRVRPALTVVAGAITTGLLAGLSFGNVVEMLGRGFVQNRALTLFLLTLPAIALAERYGLQQQAARWMMRFGSQSVARVQIVYQLFRILHGALGIRLNGHPVFIRPLLHPMSMAVAPPSSDEEVIKRANAASENYGNFFGQNLSPVQPGVLLVASTMASLGVPVNVWMLVLYTSPVVALSILFAAIQFRRRT